MPTMAPFTPEEQQASNPAPQGPDPSIIQVAKPYIFESTVQRRLRSAGIPEQREDAARLQGVAWIDSVRKALQLPVRTYNTACVYYHKFRLAHPDVNYAIPDAAAAALFNACKIEDTLKKSRDILCAAWNHNRSANDHLSPDDPGFDNISRNVVSLERMMLESNGFDFRSRYPQKMLMKLVKSCGLDRNTVGVTAYRISLDLYRTFAPLKQTTQTMALACLELSARLFLVDLTSISEEKGFDYGRWATSRAEIMNDSRSETMTDLLELYTHHRNATLVGPEYALDVFIQIRIKVNQEASQQSLPRYTNCIEVDNGSPSEGAVHNNGAIATPTSISPQSPARGAVALGEKGRDGTVRFMLDPERARVEKDTVKRYFTPEEKEWVEEYVYV
ncbi:MAG: hypothetical protein Q9159_003703 [Coniocarpon cinnabarinum]